MASRDLALPYRSDMPRGRLRDHAAGEHGPTGMNRPRRTARASGMGSVGYRVNIFNGVKVHDDVKVNRGKTTLIENPPSGMG
jgi:hypothetical protein